MPDQAKEVWGVVYELQDDELKNLDKREDYRPGKPYGQSKYTREDHYVSRGSGRAPREQPRYNGLRLRANLGARSPSRAGSSPTRKLND